ncbi:MAG: AmmeMemoRadiSam system radical SAM enzyme [Clostridiales Family XIII bacterium]|jgi:pyruvate formate lyase activating enzyme|nr:AmmeMemoRadiSam system radical SAM enzyme [Clostridiales Family XIII bacterium]
MSVLTGDGGPEYVCDLCPNLCRLRRGDAGACRARAGGEKAVVSLNYGKLTSIALDPIEKKPLSRFHPGSKILSIGSFGCNLRCPWCQNHGISMAGAESPLHVETADPQGVAEEAARLSPAGNIGVAYTYNEPLVGFEFVYDTARAVKARGLKNVLVTNGYANGPYWEKLLPLMDAMNIDLKSYRADFYKRIGGDLDVVKANIRSAAAQCRVELTCLLIDGENDSGAEMEDMAGFIAGISEDIPLHISRAFPRYRYTGRAPTNLESMRRAAKIAKKRLRYVELGNI